LRPAQDLGRGDLNLDRLRGIESGSAGEKTPLLQIVLSFKHIVFALSVCRPFRKIF
jgi:hypothetical protein